jgi:hypothetical protein
VGGERREEKTHSDDLAVKEGDGLLLLSTHPAIALATRAKV